MNSHHAEDVKHLKYMATFICVVICVVYVGAWVLVIAVSAIDVFLGKFIVAASVIGLLGLALTYLIDRHYGITRRRIFSTNISLALSKVNANKEQLT